MTLAAIKAAKAGNEPRPFRSMVVIIHRGEETTSAAGLRLRGVRGLSFLVDLPVALRRVGPNLARRDLGSRAGGARERQDHDRPFDHKLIIAS